MRHHCPDVKLEIGESAFGQRGLHSLAKRSQGSGFQSQRRRKAVDDLFTCFANPVHVPVHLLLQLLLLLQEQEAGPGLHPVLLLRKFAV